MAIGGYKFCGYVCDTQATKEVCVNRIHKTRVKAFLDASRQANAGWEIDYKNGNLDFEEGDRAVYSLDEQGHNLVTTFKNGNNAVFWICTFCHWTTGNADLANGIIKINDYLDVSSDGYKVRDCTCFHRIGNIRQEPSNNVSQQGLSCIIPAGATSRLTTSENTTSVDLNSNYVFLTSYNYKCGYAVKGKDIISLQVIYNSSTIAYSLLSANVFSTVFDKNDSWANFGYIPSTLKRTLYDDDSTGENDGGYLLGESTIDRAYFYYADGNGNQQKAEVNFIPNTIATFSKDATTQPFASVYVATKDVISGHNLTGIGGLKTEAVSQNMMFGGSSDYGLGIGKIVADGNYICVAENKQTSNTPYLVNLNLEYSSKANVITSVFFGWDASNPHNNVSAMDNSTGFNEYNPPLDGQKNASGKYPTEGEASLTARFINNQLGGESGNGIQLNISIDNSDGNKLIVNMIFMGTSIPFSHQFQGEVPNVIDANILNSCVFSGYGEDIHISYYVEFEGEAATEDMPISILLSGGENGTTKPHYTPDPGPSPDPDPDPEPEPEPEEATKAHGQFPVLSIEAASVGVDGDEIYVTFQKSNPDYGDSYIDFSAYDKNGNLYVTSSGGNLSTDEPITAEKLNAFHDDGNNSITNYMTFSGVLDPASVPEYDEDPLTIHLSGGGASAKATGTFAKVPADLEVEAANSGTAGNNLRLEIYQSSNGVVVDIYDSGSDDPATPVFTSYNEIISSESGVYISASTFNAFVDNNDSSVVITQYVVATGEITVPSDNDAENPIIIQLSGGEEALT